MTEQEIQNYIPPKDAGLILNMPTAKVTELCNKGKIEGAIKFGHFWMVPRDGLQKYLNNLKNDTDNYEGFHNIYETSKILDLSASRVYQLYVKGQLKGEKKKSGLIYFSAESVTAFKDARERDKEQVYLQQAETITALKEARERDKEQAHAQQAEMIQALTKESS